MYALDAMREMLSIWELPVWTVYNPYQTSSTPFIAIWMVKFGEPNINRLYGAARVGLAV
jgi:hypothetical protein